MGEKSCHVMKDGLEEPIQIRDSVRGIFGLKTKIQNKIICIKNEQGEYLPSALNPLIDISRGSR
jgi:hypothetical protein